jgi:transcriptional regulator with XRE-family HTH domain
LSYLWRNIGIMNWFEDPAELLKRRRQAGLSQAQLAERTGRSRSLIRDVELRKIKLQGNLAHDLWKAIAHADVEQKKRMIPLASLLNPNPPDWYGRAGNTSSEAEDLLRRIVAESKNLIAIQEELIAELRKGAEQDASKITSLNERVQILQDLLAVETEGALAQSKAEELRGKLAKTLD